ncbi:unnamed protein product [Arctogadus glacialis]
MGGEGFGWSSNSQKEQKWRNTDGSLSYSCFSGCSRGICPFLSQLGRIMQCQSDLNSYLAQKLMAQVEKEKRMTAR